MISGEFLAGLLAGGSATAALAFAIGFAAVRRVRREQAGGEPATGSGPPGPRWNQGRF